jgi:fatty acid-binding protein DegV
MANIVTDTTACLAREQVQELGIEVVPVEFIFGDRSYRDGIDLTPGEFYTRLRQSKKPPHHFRVPTWPLS